MPIVSRDCFFFFSSRRRHTRFDCDWSSDVCSSDLLKAYLAMAQAREPVRLALHLVEVRCPVRLLVGGAQHDGDVGATEVALLGRSVRSFALDSRSEEHTSELQSQSNLVCRLLLEKK